MIVVISGPGGVGKGTVVQRLVEQDPRLWLSRSWTTREPRPGESEDAYTFVDRDAFEDRIASGGFLEYAEFLGNLYGTPTPDDVPAGQDVVLEIDVQGAAQVRSARPTRCWCSSSPRRGRPRPNGSAARGDPADEVERRLAKGDQEVAGRPRAWVPSKWSTTTSTAAVAESGPDHRRGSPDLAALALGARLAGAGCYAGRPLSLPAERPSVSADEREVALMAQVQDT